MFVAVKFESTDFHLSRIFSSDGGMFAEKSQGRRVLQLGGGLGGGVDEEGA